MNSMICIALCSYNGEAFLKEQIESILAQSVEGWTLVVRDDGSSDSSINVLESFKLQDSRVTLMDDDHGNLGAKENFAFLLKKAATLSSDYFAFSDQDDIWVANKLSEQSEVMRKVEQRNPDTPVLLHTDLEVVDASLNMMAPSLMEYQGIKHEETYPLNVLLTQNFVTGCTVMVNRKLLDIALPIPEEALMHDWWLALCAAVCGKIEYIDKPFVKYRQHGSNAVGAKHISDFFNPVNGEWIKRWFEGRDNLFKSMKQAYALAERIRKYDPNNEHLKLIETYASLRNKSPIQRLKTIRKLGVHAQSKARQALMLSRLLLTPRGYDVG